jgi:hypothetical protein
MNKKIIWLIGALLLIYFFNSFFTKGMIAGTYVNRNYENDFALGVPHVPDTLVIYPDNKFYSPYYGKGNYELKYSPKGTRIELNYRDEYGSDGFNTSINRLMFIGSPKIDLFEDFNQHYEKID